MNLKECRDAALKLINQYSIAGSTIALSYNNQADYVLRTTELINDAQMEISKTTRKIYAQHTITQMLVPNLLPDTALEQKTHLDEDDIYETDGVAKAYYFELNKPATVYIEHKVDGVWTPVVTITAVPTAPGFTVYKGRVNCTGASRIRFSGEYPYAYRYYALYEYSFPDEASVPAYRPYVEYTMPTDFFQLVGRGIPLYKGKDFLLSHDYEWRGRNVLLLRRDLEGEFIIDYYRYPTKVTSTTADTVELDNVAETHEAIPYFVASGIVRQDDPSISATLYNIFETRLVRMGEPPMSDFSPIEDIYGFAGALQ